VLAQLVRDRIMPPQFLKQHPAEAAFSMSLLHPHPAARLGLQEVLRHERLAVVCDALQQRRRALQQQQAGSDREVLQDFLQIMRVRCRAALLHARLGWPAAAAAATWCCHRCRL
jgi:hypothetical protein